MRIIIDMLDYRGEPMDAKYWDNSDGTIVPRADGTVSPTLIGQLERALEEANIPQPNTITVTWEESKP